MGDGNFRPLTESTPLDRSPKNLVHVITSTAPTAAPNLVQIRRWGFWASGWNITNFFIYTFFSWTHLQVRPVDGFSRLMAKTTRTCARICLLWVSLTLLPILGIKSPENPNFWGVNSSQMGKILKVSCYRNYLIDFNQILHNDRVC